VALAVRVHLLYACISLTSVTIPNRCTTNSKSSFGFVQVPEECPLIGSCSPATMGAFAGSLLREVLNPSDREVAHA
jgi:hypothetical protein